MEFLFRESEPASGTLSIESLLMTEISVILLSY
jgi:hypothetical protein